MPLGKSFCNYVSTTDMPYRRVNSRLSVVRLLAQQHARTQDHATREYRIKANFVARSFIRRAYSSLEKNAVVYIFISRKNAPFCVYRKKKTRKKKKKKSKRENGNSSNKPCHSELYIIVNGVYLFYGLFRAEPTGGPKISTRRKRRAGRASE